MTQETNKEIYHGFLSDVPKEKDIVFGARGLPYEILQNNNVAKIDESEKILADE